MNRPTLETLHVPDGDKQLTDAVTEGPSPARVWVSQFLALLLLAAGLYAVTRGAIEYPETADEVRRLRQAMGQADLSLTNLPASGQGAGADWGASMKLWREKNAERYGVVRLHLYGCYGLLGLCPVALLFAGIVWWRGQSRRPDGRGPLDGVQISMNVAALLLLAGLRIFDAATESVLDRTPAVPDLQAFLKTPTQAQKAERLAAMRARLEQTVRQIQEPKSTVATRAAAAHKLSAVVWDREFRAALTDADKQALQSTLKELAARTRAEDETCPVLTRAIGAAGDAALAQSLEAERESTRPNWVDVRRPEAVRCFFNAVALGRVDDVRTLLTRGVNVNAVLPTDRHTALHEAVARRQVKVAELLIEKGARVDLAGENLAAGAEKEFPLHRAVGEPGLVRILLDKGADPNVADYRGMTPLHVAAATGDGASIELLLSRKAKLNALDLAKRTPLDLARSESPKGQAGPREVLVQHGALTSAQLAPKHTAEASISPDAR